MVRELFFFDLLELYHPRHGATMADSWGPGEEHAGRDAERQDDQQNPITDLQPTAPDNAPSSGKGKQRKGSHEQHAAKQEQCFESAQHAHENRSVTNVPAPQLGAAYGRRGNRSRHPELTQAKEHLCHPGNEHEVPRCPRVGCRRCDTARRSNTPAGYDAPRPKDDEYPSLVIVISPTRSDGPTPTLVRAYCHQVLA
jgi:hypothetical protein